MSFGPSQATKTATDQNAKISTQQVNNSVQQMGQGTSLLGQGGGNLQSGTNYFNTLLNGNQANTTALLQPNIDQIRSGTQANLSAISNLYGRGGGRSGALFNAAYAPSQQINSLFNTARTGAAGNLAQIGLQQQGLGTNLINSGNLALNSGASTNEGLMNYGLAQQKQTGDMWSGLGNGLLKLGTAPFGANGTATATRGLLGLI